jgi:hypothetical protein
MKIENFSKILVQSLDKTLYQSYTLNIIKKNLKRFFRTCQSEKNFSFNKELKSRKGAGDMKKKVVAGFLLIVFFFSPCCLNGAFAAVHYTTTKSSTIAAWGSLQTPVVFGVSIVGPAGQVPNRVEFVSSTADVKKSSQIVKMEFDYTNPSGNQVILVSTNNRNNAAGHAYTGTGSGAGLVNLTDRSVSAPLHWVIFNTQAEATSYTYASPVDTTKEYYIVDRQQDKANYNPPLEPFDSANVTGYASAVYNINGKKASLSNAGVLPTAAVRTITNGEAYMAIACNYTSMPPAEYITDTLTLDLATLT